MSALNLYIHNRRLDFSKASVRKTETNCRQWAKNKGLVSPNKFSRRCSVAFLINDELAEWRTHFIIYQRYRRALEANKFRNRDSVSKRRMLTRSPTCCRRQVNSLEVQRRHDIRRRCTGKERTEMLGVCFVGCSGYPCWSYASRGEAKSFLISEKTDSITWLNLPTDADSLGEREAGNKSDNGRREFTRILPGLRREKWEKNEE